MGSDKMKDYQTSYQTGFFDIKGGLSKETSEFGNFCTVPPDSHGTYECTPTQEPNNRERGIHLCGRVCTCVCKPWVFKYSRPQEGGARLGLRGGGVGKEAVRMSALLFRGPELHTTYVNTLIYYKWTSIILVVISAFQSHRVELDALALVPSFW